MNTPIIEVENLSKIYRLGSLGAKSFADDIRSLWNWICRKKEPLDPKVLEQLDSSGASSQINPECKNEFWALNDINFKINPGEVVGIIGHNGAGKSTLLKILSRITEPTSGQITIRGRVSSLLEVGTGFHPDLTGRENTYLNGAIHGMSKSEIDSKFDDIIDFAKIRNFVDTPVKRYSSGMFVRLAFSVAAYLEPEILIVDEVLAVGDAEFQGKCLEKMKDIAQRGNTVIFVSHIMTSVKILCQQCILLQDGKILNQGPTSKIIEQYLSTGQNLGNAEVLNPDRFTYNTGEAILESVTVMDRARNPKVGFRYHEPINVRLSVKVAKKMDNLVMSLYFCSLDGVPISFGCSSDVLNQTFPVETGVYYIDVETSIALLPGPYCIKASLFHPSGATICVAERACDFRIERFAENDQNSYKWERSNAYAFMPTKWEIHQENLTTK